MVSSCLVNTIFLLGNTLRSDVFLLIGQILRELFSAVGAAKFSVSTGTVGDVAMAL